MNTNTLSRRQRARIRETASGRNILNIGERQQQIVKEARDLLNQIDSASDKDAADLERRHDALMAEYDELEEKRDRRERTNELEKRYNPGYVAPPGGPSGLEPSHDSDVLPALTRDQKFVDHIRSRDGDEDQIARLPVGSYLRALVTGARTELEERALSVGTGSAGGFSVPSILAAALIDTLRARSVAVRAGARTVPLESADHSWAKVASDPVPAWRAELGSVAESDPTFASVQLQPKSLAVLVRVSRELLADSINLEQQLPGVISGAMAVEWDRAALFGAGTGSEPLGVANVTGIGNVAHDAALASYAPMVSAQTLVRTANAEPGGFIMHPRDAGTLAGLTDSTGQPLDAPRSIADVPMLSTTSTPVDGGAGSNESVIVTGDFQHLLLGVREDINVRVLTERFADTGEVGLLVHFRGDVNVEHAAAFATITGITP